jgi:hypothetical protein
MASYPIDDCHAIADVAWLAFGDGLLKLAS